MRSSVFWAVAFLLGSTAVQADGGLHWDAVLELPAVESHAPGIVKVCPPDTRIAKTLFEGLVCVSPGLGLGEAKPRELSLQDALEWHLGVLPDHIAVARGPLPSQTPNSVLVAYKRYPKPPRPGKRI